MRVEEFIGRRIRTERERLDLSQDELGRLLGPLLGKPWPRQAVSAAERGDRAFAAVELVALAQVTGLSVAEFLAAPADVAHVTMPTGAQVDAVRLSGRVVSGDQQVLADMARSAVDLVAASKAAAAALGDIDRVREAAQTLADQLSAAAKGER